VTCEIIAQDLQVANQLRQGFTGLARPLSLGARG
jgi:hypothetical protein